MQATITGYHIHATDGEIGPVEDFMVDDENCAIRFLVVATRNWLPLKIVLSSILPNPSAGITKRFF